MVSRASPRVNHLLRSESAEIKYLNHAAVLKMLSHEGRALFCLGMQQPKMCLQGLVRKMFHTDYDDQVERALDKCRKCSQSLCAQLETPYFEHRMDMSILRVLKIILKSRHPARTYRFFLDLARQAHRSHDHQTANVLCVALGNDMLAAVKKPAHIDETLRRMKTEYGYPSYDKHVHFFHKVRTPHVIPSVFAFSKFIKQKQFVDRTDEVGFALHLLEIYKYLKLDERDILPLYKLEDQQESGQLEHEINDLAVRGFH